MSDSKMRFSMRTSLAWSLAVFLAVPINSGAASAEIQSSTTTARSAKPRRKGLKGVIPKGIRQMPRRIRQGIKKIQPNPKVQPPEASVLPPQAPLLPPVPVPPPTPPVSGAERFFAAVTKLMTKSWGNNVFVWLPAFSTDPNAGPTTGILPVLVLADPQTQHIRHLVAPSYTFNTLFGQTVTGRYYFYPTDASQLYAIASYSQHTNREYKVRYENTSAYEGVLYLGGEVYYSEDGSLRFFGLGPKTNQSDESGYTGRDGVVRGTIGVNFAKAWRISFGARYRRFTTDPNIIPNTTDLSARYPRVPGVGTQKTVAPEVRLLWDTRDYPITPSRGSSGEIWFENPSPVFNSDAEFIKYGILGERFFRWPNPRQLTVVHGLYEWANGSNIPFYERPSIGGQKTLRGFGDGRFTDRGRLVLNLEQRMTVASLALMGIQANFELAPFFDLGTVFPTLPQIQRKYFYPVYGLGFRAAVKPNVVGNVEVGVGKEGPAVFVGINYPF
jgi:hypothetical protein